ncbi:hypothetical protein [Priestia taiwanensis]|uniref:Uncharacterized protein n=1 Tax=Priestia taiwanensis TaxID=1347902 RepID=A0A917ENR7_9BACI|nr:hypothetical protein [Priestia taiwanensis]MBM7363150.1 ketosteroid isomerase-like protein [Priestia taiwanensis]GGE68108.1 hypothetical protein GCM10007140_17700 [Priestia taiwanensis]
MTIRKKWGLLSLLILLVIGIIGCTEKANENTSTPKEENTSSIDKKKDEKDKATIETEIKEMLKVHEDAYNKEDIDTYMSTMSQSSALLEQTKQMTQLLFDSFDVQVEFTDIKITTSTEASATVEIIQKTVSKKPNPDFQDNITTATHFLVKEDNKWRISASTLKKITDLKGNPIQQKT